MAKFDSPVVGTFISVFLFSFISSAVSTHTTTKVCRMSVATFASSSFRMTADAGSDDVRFRHVILASAAQTRRAHLFLSRSAAFCEKYKTDFRDGLMSVEGFTRHVKSIINRHEAKNLNETKCIFTRQRSAQLKAINHIAIDIELRVGFRASGGRIVSEVLCAWSNALTHYR